ncbi:MAG: ABC transporter substrate-binding protein [Candidatus Heimdallarchaeum aukensis]|uniref:ABC transporter substrate-binding protein n=1 Tax=Candidatus Heimdallarchaeum aukensis TaxID=2876573 RepID=A0A9Y1BN35_9ARCH|nr:MAG: ABC transporter substrate-binding protein [Candidatus Heimdallarchaeum aukensis]
MTKNSKIPEERKKKIPKGLIYLLALIFIITAIFAIIVFVPQPPPTNALFSVSIRSYTTGYEKSYYSEYSTTIQTNLGLIGINAEVKSTDYATFLDKVVVNKDYDLAILEFEMESSPHLEVLFRENASLNIFNYKNDLDNSYVINKINLAEKTIDFEERRNIYFDIQTYLMKDVLPFVPLFTPVNTFAYWKQVNNFSAELGLSDSLPYMYLSDASKEQLKVGIGYWNNIDPLNSKRTSEKQLVSLFMDKLIKTASDGSIIGGGLIKKWKFENETTLLLTIRSNVYWQQDVDKEYTDEQFTIDDVIFTLNVFKSPYVNNEYHQYDWIKKITKVNETTIAIAIDSDRETKENDPYAYALDDLSIYALPEHYLNVTGSWEGITSSTNWVKFSSYPFGTGKYKINFEETEKGVTIVLDKFEKWHGAGVIPNSPTDLNIQTLWINTYRDNYALLLSLQNKDVDFAIFGKDSQIANPVSNSEIEIQHSPSNSIVVLAFNLDNKYFGGDNNFVNTTEESVSKALAVRKAIAYAVNREQLNEGFHDSFYIITDTIIPYGTKYYYSGTEKYDFSIQKAINYLEIAGFSAKTENNTETSTAPGTLWFSSFAVLFISTTKIILRHKKER